MTRIVTVGAAQLGPVQRGRDPQGGRRAAARAAAPGRDDGCELVVFPELALTTFFPRWFFEDRARDRRLVRARDALARHPAAVRRGRPVSASASAWATPSSPPDGHHYNTQMLVERDGGRSRRYRKVHLPGHEDHEPWRPFQHLERHYFEPGPEASACGGPSAGSSG